MQRDILCAGWGDETAEGVTNWVKMEVSVKKMRVMEDKKRRSDVNDECFGCVHRNEGVRLFELLGDVEVRGLVSFPDLLLAMVMHGNVCLVKGLKRRFRKEYDGISVKYCWDYLVRYEHERGMSTLVDLFPVPVLIRGVCAGVYFRKKGYVELCDKLNLN